MSMDTDTKITAFFVIGIITIIAALVIGMFYFSFIESKQKDRELAIREREIELKAEQYPYKSETKVEVTHE